MKTKKLILFTAAYPYGSGETFLETEIDYLSKSFDQVIIVSNNVDSESMRVIPTNCRIIRRTDVIGKKDKLRALFLMFNAKVKAERKIIQETYKLQFNKGVRNTMLISFYRANQVRYFCEELLLEEGKDSYCTFYSYWSNDNAVGLALLKDKHPEVKAITRTHGWDLYFEVTQDGYQSFRHLLGEKLNAIYPISQRGVMYCKETWQINGDNVKLSRLGVLEQTIKIKTEDVFTLVSCSNVIPLKRVELILEALKLVKNQIHWVHFGAGKGLDALMLEAKNVPSNVQVKFMGHVENTAVINWYQENKVNLFVNASTTEGIPVSIMEAMSFGIPVLATDVGGTSEIINSLNGKLISPEITAEELAIEIGALISLSNEEWSKLKENALNTWREKYNAKMNYSQFANSIAQFS